VKPIKIFLVVSTTLAVAAGTTVAFAGETPSVGADGRGDPYFPQDGNGGYDVSRYDVTVTLDPADPAGFTGDTTVHATATQDLDRFNLDLEGFTVGGVTVDGVAARAARSGAHELVVTPAATVRKGATFAVRVTYSGAPVGKSWHQLTSGGVSVTGEPHSATAWFPVDDHPSDKAALHLTATVPTGWTVVGNGRPGPTTEQGGRTTFRWNEDSPIVSYATTMSVDRFTVRTSALPDGTPVINAYGQGAEPTPASEALVPQAMDFLTRTFGPYPFTSTGSVVVNPVNGDDSLALETQTRPTYTGGFFDASAVHELAHQWWGDSVSFTDWRDGCLAECFAQYAGQLWDEDQNGADPDEGYRSIVAENKDKPEYWKVRLYDPGADRPLDGALYERGPLMLHALRRTVGDKVFFPMLRDFLAAHRHGNASWPQFEAFAAKASGQDLTGFFNAWARGSTVPADRYLFPPGV
jgi:aminopeptidase N